ncbi:MAG: hypothetical protein PHT91_03610 [Candidatus Nanoarchaeia archaeon]|nr:hypothetical protein [Candidatus Nanoarchaeia archaeon]MDD5054309.1 hypothetical protein [Candidatus Nanoarchaeia archaeon]MDD5499931.1 hypothetical protein [Candidatus Nanoarchaeia archaeon]
MQLEYRRKIFHILLGIALSIIIFNVRKIYLVSIITGILCAGVLIRLLLLKGFEFKILAKFFINFGRPYEVGMGAMNFFVGVLLSLILPFPREYAAISVLILGISDGLATIAGIASKYRIWNKKTFHGTTAFFISTYLILSIYMNSMISSLLISIGLTILELFSPVDDNLLIPVAGTMLISFMKLI